MTSACTVEVGGRACGATAGVRAYLPGPACPAHTPARLAGRPEPVPDPALTLEVIQERTFGARRPVTPDTRPRLGKFGVEVERARLAERRDAAAKTIRADVPPAAGVELSCPGCHRHPRSHAAHCPMGPRARFAMAADGSIVGTIKRGPE